LARCGTSDLTNTACDRNAIRSRRFPSAKIDPQVARRARARRRRRCEPHHRRDEHHLHGHRRQALPEKDRVAERDDAARHHAAVRDDVADLRLQRAGGHVVAGSDTSNPYVVPGACPATCAPWRATVSIGPVPPAELTRMSIRPNASSACATRAFVSSSDVTSHRIPITRRSPEEPFSSPTTTSIASWSRPATTTPAPAAAISSPTVRPIPFAPPVTTATRPSSSRCRGSADAGVAATVSRDIPAFPRVLEY